MDAPVGPRMVTDEQLENLSASARRLLTRPRPRFRGVLHRWAAAMSVPVGIVITVVADGATATLALAVFSIGVFCMLGASALVHCRDWGAHQVETLVRLDHSAIFLMFATSATPIARLGLTGSASTWLLVVLWCGATVGIVAEWLPVHPPAGVMNAAYLTFGWGTVAFLPWLLTDLSARQLLLLFAGGMAYTVGAVVVGSRQPDPWPNTFGYHEIWHLLVVVAVVAHTAMALDLAGI